MLDRLMRPLALFEMPEFGGGGGGGDELSVFPAAAAAPASEPAPAAPVAPPAPGEPPVATDPPAPAPAPSYSHDEFEQELEARLAPFAQYMPVLEALMDAANDPNGLGLGGPPAPTGHDLLELDPLSEEFGTQLQQMLANERNQTLQEMQQTMARMLAPITGRFEAEALGEGDERAMDIIADDIAQHGEILDESKTLARQLSELYFPEFAGRYGTQGVGAARAAEAALRKAASTVRAIEQAAEKRGEERYKNQLATLGGAPPVPGAHGTGIVTVPPGGDEMSVYRRHAGLATG